MEKKDVVICPECSAENPKSRATCQICHSPLYKTKEVGKVKKAEGTREPKKVEEKTKVESKIPPPTTPLPPVSKPIPDPFTSKQSSKEPPPLSKDEVSKPPTKRRARRKSHVVIESQYFILQGQNLMPVEITQHVKVLKRKMMKDEAAMLIDLWNHNKGLLVK